MLTKLYHTLAVVSLAVVLAGGGLAAYLYFSGRVNAADFAQIAQILRGQARASPPPAEPAPPPPPPETPADLPPPVSRGEAPLRRAELERARRDVQAERELLSRSLEDLIARSAQFERQKAEWLAQQQKLRSEAREAGFARELEYLARLAPKQAKEHLVLTWKKDPSGAVRLINAVPTAVGLRILDQMRSQDEIVILHELLEQLRTLQADSSREAQDAKRGVAANERRPERKP